MVFHTAGLFLIQVMKLLLTIIISILVRMGWAQSDTLIIQSQVLHQSIRVIHDSPHQISEDAPMVYITDGEKMIHHGAFIHIQSLIKNQEISLAHFVFISTLDVENPQIDYREKYFFCNADYLRFFEQELIPQVETHLKVSMNAQKRLLLGLSFGGLNGAYFMAKSTLFQNYALLSPITYPCKNILSEIAFSENQALKVFLSTGTNDAERYLNPLAQVLQSKNYEVKVVKTSGGHTFENWQAQLKPCLNYFW